MNKDILKLLNDGYEVNVVGSFVIRNDKRHYSEKIYLTEWVGYPYREACKYFSSIHYSDFFRIDQFCCYFENQIKGCDIIYSYRRENGEDVYLIIDKKKVSSKY